MKKQGYFIAGTDTGVGKTLVSAALLHKVNELGLRSMGLKPVSAGCTEEEDGWRNEDAVLMEQVASCKLPYAQINPITLEAPVSPHIAAHWQNKTLSAQRIVGFCRGAMITPHDVCIVEGAGGWRVPIGPRETMADLAKLLNLPVVLVVGMRLGCLNHAILTAESIVRDGLSIAGWVANVVDREMLALDENIATLENMFPFPLLAHIPYNDKPSPEYAAKYVDINKLIGELED